MTSVVLGFVGINTATAASAGTSSEAIATLPTSFSFEVTGFNDDMNHLQGMTIAALGDWLSAAQNGSSASIQRMTTALHAEANGVMAQGKRVGTLIAVLRQLPFPERLKPQLSKLIERAKSLRNDLLAEARAQDPTTSLDKNQRETFAFEYQLSAFQEAAVSELNATGWSSAALVAASRSSMRSTARLTMTVSLDVGGIPQLNAQGSGVAAFRNNALELNMTYSSPQQVAGLALSERVVDGHFYVGTPQIAQVIPHAAWVRIPLDQVSTGALGNGISNPLTVVNPPVGRGVTVVQLSPDTINGTPTVVCGLATSRTRTIDQLRGAHLPSWAIQSIEAGISARGVRSEFWVDSANHVVQMITDLPLPIQGRAAVWVRMTLSAYNYWCRFPYGLICRPSYGLMCRFRLQHPPVDLGVRVILRAVGTNQQLRRMTTPHVAISGGMDGRTRLSSAASSRCDLGGYRP